MRPSGLHATPEESDTTFFWKHSLTPSYVSYLGRRFVGVLTSMRGLGAFALITLGVTVSKFGSAREVMRPLVLLQIARAGLRLLPLTFFVSGALGLVVIGQAVAVLNRVGVNDWLGTVMVIAVVRELGPMLTAVLVLSRVGTATVVELGMARAVGEVEALEVLGIDPIHYLVVPRVVGMATAMFSLTIYMILGALISGYLWAFIQDVPLSPTDYLRQMAAALQGLDFVVLAGKTMGFGAVIALVTCYQGLAQPLSIGEVSRATVRAVGQSIILCGLVEALSILIYLL